MEKYRVFVEDVGPNKFSAFGDRDVEANFPLDAIFEITGVVRVSLVGKRWLNGEPPCWEGCLLIALPHSRKDLWPNGKTGAVPKQAIYLQSANAANSQAVKTAQRSANT